MSEPARAVFLSCARDDAAAARRIADALRSTGSEVWFDQNELEGGDAWDTKIRKQIQLCALFVPVISAATQARGEEYFRLEWKLAVDRSHLMADDAPFLFPVVIDDTTDAAARVGRLLAKADDEARKKSFRALFSRLRFKLRPISFPMGSISRSFLRLGSVWVGCRCLLAANPAFVRAGRPAKAPRPQNPYVILNVSFFGFSPSSFLLCLSKFSPPMKSTLSRLLVAALFSAAALAPVSGQTSVPTTVAAPATVAPIAAKSLDGHSAHGEAFDSGPRQKPWVMEGIGHAPFPITTKNPEVQTWFNQGNALLHSFAWHDAERAFRWCLKIEPGNVMAYWGLALATEARDPSGPNRAADFLREAVKCKAEVTERERLFIEAWVPILLPDLITDPADEAGSDRYSGRNGEHIKRLETLCIKFPDDMEARAYLARATMGGGRYGTELIIREILAHQPTHPGAHHYRIHNWDYHEPEQALASCRAYTAEVPGIGHAQHMPGHIYSIIGMWDEAAISMDAATRLEKRAMQDSFTFTFDNWNYGHNRAYLSYIQEQLGLPEAALAGARQMVDAPLDPQRNSDNIFSTHSQGLRAVARVLLKYQRWDELLLPATIPWREVLEDRINKQYVEARAHLGRGDTIKAQKSIEAHVKLKKEAEADGMLKGIYVIQALELKARLALTRGETLVGLGLLADAAEKEFTQQREYADPPIYPEALYNTLGEAYLDAKSPLLAAQAFEKALTLTKNDLFALSGLVRAYSATGETAKATDAMARLLYVTRNADAGLWPVALARKTGITAAPHGNTPAPQRDYSKTALDGYGPSKWEPYKAPQLSVVDGTGKTVTLADYAGKNVILVFYLNEECAHCMEQLQAIGAKKADWAKLDTVVLAVSSAKADPSAMAFKPVDGAAVQLLTDTDHANARRFKSYDDFEEIELHSTTLIDKQGRAYWARFGGDPFKDTAFLEKQLKRMNDLVAPPVVVPPPIPTSVAVAVPSSK